MFSSPEHGGKSLPVRGVAWDLWGDRFRDGGLALTMWFLPITISLAELGVVLCLIGLLLAAAAHRRCPPRLGEEGWILAFAACAVVAALASPDRWARLEETHVLLWIGAGYAAAAAWGRTADTAAAGPRPALRAVPRSVESGWHAFAVAAGALGVWLAITYSWAAWRHGTDLKLLGSMSDGQFFMVALLQVCAAFLWPGASGAPARLGIVLAPLLAAGLWINLKRGSWISFAASFALQAWHRSRRAVLVVGAGMAALVVLLPASRARILDLRTDLDPQRGGRFGMWTRAAPALIRDHPLGVGIGGTTEAVLRGYYPDLEPRRDHLHNNVLQVTAETGWLGGLCWCGWMLAAGRRLWRSYRTFRRAGAAREAVWALFLATAFLALMCNGLIEYNFGDSEIAVLLYLIMGSGRALDRRREGLRPPADAPPG